MPEVVQELLSKVDVNVLDDQGQTALHVAVYRGYLNVVSRLLGEPTVDTEIRDVWGDTPLDIVISVMENESHPGPNLEDLRQIRQLLFKRSRQSNKQYSNVLLKGPSSNPTPSRNSRGVATSVFASPLWNPGLGFQATITDFLEEGGDEYLFSTELSVDELLYRRGAIKEKMDPEGNYRGKGKRKLRWIHLPANNASLSRAIHLHKLGTNDTR